ncbi:MAG TPA: hypothetical protein VF139_10870 [Candidatus Polarisedimenticolaceae bacterium]
MKRAAYVVLCILPCVVLPLAAIRDLRVSGLSQAIGWLLFATLAAAVWVLSRGRQTAGESDPRLRIGGLLLLVPIALMACEWVGIGTPWDATPEENRMRYAVLLAMAIAVAAGSYVVADALRDAGEKRFAPLALVLGLLSGSAYVVWTSFQLGDFALRIAGGERAPGTAAINNVFDALLFAAGVLAYLATACLACALGRAGRLGPVAAHVYLGLNLLACVMLLARGVSYPTPASGLEAWYTRPGFIAGIPAMPWIMPYFLGVILVRDRGGASA